MHPSNLDFEQLSRLDLTDGGRRLADQYVDGANCSALQIGSTPKRSRWASM